MSRVRLPSPAPNFLSLMKKLLLFSILLVSCGRPPVQPQSPLDRPESHYKQGIAELESGQVLLAERAFNRSRALDDSYPGYSVGKALISLRNGEYHDARKRIDAALRKDRNFVDAHIALGRIVSEEGVALGRSTSAWLNEAENAYRRAEKLSDESQDVAWYWAQSYAMAGELGLAREKLQEILAVGRGNWVEKALSEVERLQKAERSAPGSRAGIEIGLKAEITRAEWSVLLVDELKLPELIRKRGDVVQTAPTFDLPADIESSWASAWIREIIAVGLMGLQAYPDGNFYPDRILTRAQYAQANQAILILLSGDESLSYAYIGKESRFPDLRADNYAYNALALSLERGLLEIADRRTGAVNPEGSVSGAQALLAIRQLQNSFRIEY
jgi:hypothetical protein